jgi:hypothetical protein
MRSAGDRLPPEVNIPEVVAEVREAFLRYEAALVAHDVRALDAFFWDSPHAIRYGLAEHGHGIAAIRAQRRRAAPVPPGRRLHATVIATFGRDAAAVSTEFTAPGAARIGRQTQSWVRIDGAWRIVAAHVSLVDAAALARE